MPSGWYYGTELISDPPKIGGHKRNRTKAKASRAARKRARR